MKRIRLITLLTDFGLQDEYVGVMKGVIFSINSNVQIVDISHNLIRHDIMQAALTIKAAFAYFPKGSIHLIVVDPGVGGKRNIICLKKDGHFFIAPDNGVLSLLIRNRKAEEIRTVSNRKYLLDPISNTFHGRDVLAPAAAHLSRGVDMLRLGQELSVDDIHMLDFPEPFLSSNNVLTGQIISVDHFGNLVTNIDQEALERFRKARKSQNVIITLGKSKVGGVSRSYDSAGAGSPVAVFGSRNLLEISVNQADARAHFNASIGEFVKIRSVTK